MNENQRNSERGQAFVLIVLGIVVLLGFTALAVDGSMLYSDRRYAQNGADASSLAGGGAAGKALGFVVTSPNWTTSNVDCRNGNAEPAARRAKEAAQARAADNDFSIAPVLTEAEFDANDNAVYTQCGEEVIMPFDFHRKFMDVFVKITHDTPTAFAHFVFKGIVRNTTTAVTRIYPAEPYGFGEAIIALNPSDHCPPGGNQGAGFSGGPNVYVEGGGILSNGCINGNSSALTVTVSGGASVFYGTGLNANPTSWNFLGGGGFYPITTTLPLSQFNPPIPDCTNHTVSTDYFENLPVIDPGLYCVTTDHNKKLDFGCSTGQNCNAVVGHDVTFVLNDVELEINDNLTITLTAPPQLYTGPAMPGILFYLPISYYGAMDGSGCGDPNQEVKINGGASTTIIGTILAPCSDVSLEGSATTSIFNSQVIGWNVNVAGGGTTSVVYDDSLNGFNPGNLNLYR